MEMLHGLTACNEVVLLTEQLYIICKDRVIARAAEAALLHLFTHYRSRSAPIIQTCSAKRQNTHSPVPDIHEMLYIPRIIAVIVVLLIALTLNLY